MTMSSTRRLSFTDYIAVFGTAASMSVGLVGWAIWGSFKWPPDEGWQTTASLAAVLIVAALAADVWCVLRCSRGARAFMAAMLVPAFVGACSLAWWLSQLTAHRMG